jgi:hypothetical protein
MTTWTNDELNKIGDAEELQIASLRKDGTLRNPVTIWMVRVDDDIYVRSVNGRTSAWFRGVQTRHEGHIRAGDVDKDVIFVEEPNSDINRLILRMQQSIVVMLQVLSATSMALRRELRPSNLCRAKV